MSSRRSCDANGQAASTDVFAASFPGAAEIAATFAYFQAHTYLGSSSDDQIALANKIAGKQPSKFSTWAKVNFQTNRKQT